MTLGFGGFGLESRAGDIFQGTVKTIPLFAFVCHPIEFIINLAISELRMRVGVIPFL